MISLFKNKEEEKEFIDTFKNPFQSNNVTKIEFEIENNFWSNYKLRFAANIDFSSGDTRGSHKITAEDFPSLVRKTEEFIKNL